MPGFPTSPTRLEGDAPQAVAIGLVFLGLEDGVARGELPWRADLVGDRATGGLASGAIVTLLDHICGSAVFAALAADRSADRIGSIATLDLRIDHARPAAAGAKVTARAHCHTLTRDVAFVRAEAHDGEGATPIATVQAAFAINSPRAA